MAVLIKIINYVILAYLSGIVYSKTVPNDDSQLGIVSHLVQKRQAGEITHKFGLEKMWKIPIMLPFLPRFKLPTIFEKKKEEEKSEEIKQEEEEKKEEEEKQEEITNNLYTDISKSLEIKAYLDSVAHHIPILGSVKEALEEEEEEHKEEEEEKKEEEEQKKVEVEAHKYIPPWSYGTRWALYLGNVLVHAMSSVLEGTKSALHHYSKPPEII